MKRLNDEQRQFVTENHNLIYSFLNSNNLDIEEWYDLAAIGLCKAALNYNGEIAKFSTFAYKCMWNQVHIEMRRQSAIRRADDNAVLYYDAMFECNDDGDEATFLSLIPDLKHDTGKQATIRMALYELFSLASDKEREVLNLLCKGYKQIEIAKWLGHSQAYVSRIQQKYKKLYANGRF